MTCHVKLTALLLVACASQVLLADEKAKGPVKVFILAGQSNMEGKALASTLEPVIADAATRERFAHLKSGDAWAVRKDVWVTFLDRRAKGQEAPLHGPLSVGFGGHKLGRDASGKKRPLPSIGPELGFGNAVGDHFDEQVLLIKTAWGGKSVRRDFRPPSVKPPADEIEASLEKVRKKNPDATLETVAGSYGTYYRKMVEEVRRVLDDVGKYFPNYDGDRGYEIVGLVWFQGWNDGVGRGNPEYAGQLAGLIRDVRKDLERPNLPVVIGELGVDGPEASGWIATFRAQQAAVAAMPEFKGTVRLAKTGQYWPTHPNLDAQWSEFRAAAKKNRDKPAGDPTKVSSGEYYRKNWEQRFARELSYTSDRRYHYKGSGRCYYEMGDAMARAMLGILSPGTKCRLSQISVHSSGISAR